MRRQARAPQARSLDGARRARPARLALRPGGTQPAPGESDRRRGRPPAGGSHATGRRGRSASITTTRRWSSWSRRCPVVMAEAGDRALVLHRQLESRRSRRKSLRPRCSPLVNADRYFELFQLARLMMPLFSIIGGLAVFAWSRRLYGRWGGLLSLSLWVFCPNILAHARLITSDMCSTALGRRGDLSCSGDTCSSRPGDGPSPAGIVLGLAQLTKFSMLVLYAVWPFLWLVRLRTGRSRESGGGRATIHRAGPHPRRRDRRAAASSRSTRAIFFEGVGIPLGRVRVRLADAHAARHAGHDAAAQQQPAVRSDLAVPRQSLPRDLAGPAARALAGALSPGLRRAEDRDRRRSRGDTAGGRRSRGRRASPADRSKSCAVPEIASTRESVAYPVYLNGELRTTGWWYYYFLALALQGPGRDVAPGRALGRSPSCCVEAIAGRLVR